MQMLREMMPAHEIMMKHERYKKIMLAKDLNSRDVRTWLGGYFWVSTQTPDKHLEDLPVNWNLENKLRKNCSTLVSDTGCRLALLVCKKIPTTAVAELDASLHRTKMASATQNSVDGQAGRQAGSGVMRNIVKGKYCGLAFWMLPPLVTRKP